MRCRGRTLAVASILCSCLAQAGELPRLGQQGAVQPLDLGYGKARAAPVERANPCAAHGPGFRAAPGSTSCLRVFGSVRIDVESRRTLR